MMSRVRHTNMKIWDFSWQCYNITSPRVTPGLAWELSGAAESGHGAAGVSQPVHLSHKAQQPLYSGNSSTLKRENSNAMYVHVLWCSCVSVGVSVVVSSLFPRHQKLASSEWNSEWVEPDTRWHVTRTWHECDVTRGHVTRDETLYSATQQSGWNYSVF